MDPNHRPPMKKNRAKKNEYTLIRIKTMSMIMALFNMCVERTIAILEATDEEDMEKVAKCRWNLAGLVLAWIGFLGIIVIVLSEVHQFTQRKFAHLRNWRKAVILVSAYVLLVATTIKYV